MSTVFYWAEHSPYGPSLKFVCQAEGLAQARALADSADGLGRPSKDDRLRSNHPLAAVAARHPGDLLWRVRREDFRPHSPEEPPWQVGAEGARLLRQADVDRFTEVREAAVVRRRERRKRAR